MRARSVARLPAQIVVVLTLVGALVGIASLVPAPTASAQPAPPPTADQIFEQLGVDQVPADYVVLVDTSWSMATDNRYGQVVDTLRPFLKGTTTADRVTVYTFDTGVTRVYTGLGGPDSAALGALPSALDPDTFTDIGGAISNALTELERSDARVGSIVLITDGDNNPPTPLYRDANAPEWAELARRAAKLRDDSRSIQGYALPLSGGAQGAGLLRTVIPEAEVTDVAGVPDIAGFLDRTKRGVRAQKAKDVLAANADGAVTAEWPDTTVDLAGGQTAVPLTLRSGYEKVPVTVSGLTVDVDGAAVSLAAPLPPVDLAPGQSTTITVPLRWTPAEDWWPPYPHKVWVEPTLAVRGAVGSPWTDVLRTSGVASTVNPALTGDPQSVRVEAVVGWLPLILLLLAVALLLVVMWRLRAHRRARPPVSGRLTFSRLLTSDEGSVALGRGRTGFTFPSSVNNQPGVGSVRPVRTNNGTPALEIEYSPDGSPNRRTSDTLELSDGRVVTLSGVEFRADVSR